MNGTARFLILLLLPIPACGENSKQAKIDKPEIIAGISKPPTKDIIKVGDNIAIAANILKKCYPNKEFVRSDLVGDDFGTLFENHKVFIIPDRGKLIMHYKVDTGNIFKLIIMELGSNGKYSKAVEINEFTP